MSRLIPSLLAVVTVSLATSASADVPFRQLAHSGLGGIAGAVSASGVIVGSIRVDGSSSGNVPVYWTTPNSLPVELPSGGGGFAVDINSSGDIIGRVYGGFWGRSVIWSNNQMFMLPDLGEGAWVYDINDAGVIVGVVIEEGQFRAARWVNRQLEILPVPAFGKGEEVAVWSFAQSVNSSGAIAGTIQVAGGGSSVALLWGVDGSVSIIESDAGPTYGVGIDNAGGVCVNGFFEGELGNTATIVRPNGSILPLAGNDSGSFGSCVGRNGIAAGYYSDFSGLQPVAWPNGQRTLLELPQGSTQGFAQAVGMNGMVVGSVNGIEPGIQLPVVWQLAIEPNRLQAAPVSGERGETVELSSTSSRKSGPNVGYSVSVRVGGVSVGSAITDSNGVAKVSYTIPASTKGSQLTAEFIDETGTSTTALIQVVTGGLLGDIDGDGRVNSSDLGALLGSWGASGPADLDRSGEVDSADLGILFAGWTG